MKNKKKNNNLGQKDFIKLYFEMYSKLRGGVGMEWWFHEALQNKVQSRE